MSTNRIPWRRERKGERRAAFLPRYFVSTWKCCFFYLWGLSKARWKRIECEYMRVSVAIGSIRTLVHLVETTRNEKRECWKERGHVAREIRGYAKGDVRDDGLTARVRELREMCTWRWARLVWGPRWRRSRCLSGTKGNEGEHVCAPSRIENRESQASPPRWGGFHLLRESHAASYALENRTIYPATGIRQATRQARMCYSLIEQSVVDDACLEMGRLPIIENHLSARVSK